jgi:hypothetical protein
MMRIKEVGISQSGNWGKKDSGISQLGNQGFTCLIARLPNNLLPNYLVTRLPLTTHYSLPPIDAVVKLPQ